MSPVKNAVIRMIETLPEDSSVEDIISELYFRLKVDAGLRELDEGKGISHDEARKSISLDPPNPRAPRPRHRRAS